jgi:acyl-CoA thioester hydrolase
MGRYSTRRRVEFRDTDAAGIVHFSAFFLWMESAEHEMLRSAAVRVVDRGGDDGVDASWPRVSASCDYTAAVRFGNEIDIAVTVDEIGRSSVTYGFEFVHEGRPVAHGRVVAVRCLMHPGRRPEPVPIPDDIIDRLSAFRPDA